jgi:hypothetical protein
MQKQEEEAERQTINAKILTDTADWLRGASTMLAVDMADLLDRALLEYLGKLEKEHKTKFPRVRRRSRR